MIRSTTPVWVASSASSSRPPPAISPSDPSGRPARVAASPATAASAAFECAAELDPRRTIAFPDFRHSAAASMVTFGRASYTTAITPRGTRTLRTSSPPRSRQPSITSPTGSGSAAIVRTPAAISATRRRSSDRRSSRAKDSPLSCPASRSRAFASRIAAVCSMSASAIACSARSLTSESTVASARDARCAAAQVSATEVAIVAIVSTGYASTK